MQAGLHTELRNATTGMLDGCAAAAWQCGRCCLWETRALPEQLEKW